MADTPAAEPTPKASSSVLARTPRRRRARTLSIVVVIALAIAVYLVWRYVGAYESTDDAQIDGHVDAISAQITGHVAEVLVKDAQLAKADEVLVKIDPRDYNVAVTKAEADLAEAQAGLQSSRTDVPIVSTNTASTLDTARSARVEADAGLVAAQRQLSAAQARLETAQAQVAEAQANYQRNTDDLERYRQLVAKNEIPRQQYDQTVQSVAAAKATVAARAASVNEARENITAGEAAVQQAQTRITQADAAIRSAMTRPQLLAQIQARAQSAAARVAQQQALLDQAKLNLSYTVIRAPVTGIIGRKTVEVGENVSPGQSLMAIVPLDDIWVTANFKETQLQRIRPGQQVKFSVDADDHEYAGRVTGIGGASGSRFSALPPENATGNYVKVVQRIPVRIDLDRSENQDRLLRPGMSVTPRVYVNP
jgi:membrane fusion protein (multidrug efflux system)